jgi:hypothetical protein
MIILEKWNGKAIERKSRIPAFACSNVVSFGTTRLRRYETRTFSKKIGVLIAPLLHFIFRVFYIHLSAFRVILFYSFQLRLSESSVFTVSWIPSTLLQDIHTPNAKICGGFNAKLTAQLEYAHVWHKIWNTTSLPGSPRMAHSLRQL